MSRGRNRWEVKGHKSLSPTDQVTEFLQPHDWTAGLGGGARGELQQPEEEHGVMHAGRFSDSGLTAGQEV